MNEDAIQISFIEGIIELADKAGAWEYAEDLRGLIADWKEHVEEEIT